MNKLCVIFDLDDTLYKEIDYLKSAYRFIAEKLQTEHCPAENLYRVMLDAYNNGLNAFSVVKSVWNIEAPIETLLHWYRTHVPNIVLPEDSKNLLDFLKSKDVPIGILTDGRSVTQRNKIKSLGLNQYIPEQNIVISEEFGSEKPCEANYTYFESLYSEIDNFIYVGDNPRKDFVAPNRLGWKTVGLLDDGRNIHKQETENAEAAPKIWISKLSTNLIPLIDAVLK